MIQSMNPMSYITVWRIVPGLLLAVAFACRSAAEAPEAPAVPPGKAVSIAVSRNMPVVGETVTVERLMPDVAACDVTDPAQVDALFNVAATQWGEAPDIVVFNPSARVRGPFAELDREKVAHALAVTAYGGFLVAQAAAGRLVKVAVGRALDAFLKFE